MIEKNILKDLGFTEDMISRLENAIENFTPEQKRQLEIEKQKDIDYLKEYPGDVSGLFDQPLFSSIPPAPSAPPAQ